MRASDSLRRATPGLEFQKGHGHMPLLHEHRLGNYVFHNARKAIANPGQEPLLRWVVL